MTVRSFYYWFGVTLAGTAFILLLLNLILALLIGFDVLEHLIPVPYLLATGIIGVASWVYGAGIFRGRKKNLHMPLGDE